VDFWHPFLFVVGLVIGLMASAVLQKHRRASQPSASPTIAGQTVAGLVAVDFAKRYDIVTRPRAAPYGEPVLFRRCKIRGLTGEDVREVGGWSSSSGRLWYGWMHHWLALELEDGRAVYLPTDSVQYLEESLTG
jgi:hypothetical protein